MSSKYKKIFVGDFETTVYEGQVNTEVWASALVEINSEDVQVFHSLPDTFDYILSLNESVIIYYHNLKFDGSFWLSFLLTDLKLKQALNTTSELDFLDDKEMPANSFKYSISDMGQWYTITIKINAIFIQLRDSLKLLPFSVKKIGKSFGTKHQKLDMEYTGLRYAGCDITEEELKYIKNDVLVVKEALEIMFAEGHNSLTIGSCCLAEYKKIINFMDTKTYTDMFPDVYEMPLDSKLYGSETVGDYINKSYRGGWCYVVKGKERKVFTNGITADVNSLYPSMMSSESGNAYPTGRPHFWKGNYIPDEVNKRYFFVRIRTRFHIKENHLPFIQIKNNLLYKSTEMLETSDFYVKAKDTYFRQFTLDDGTIIDSRLTMTMTMTDYYLFLEHYDVEDFEILDGCWFYCFKGIFDEYIDKYKKIKLESKGAKRELAKLFLNNLYGKMAASKNSSFKVAFEKDDGSIGFTTVQQFEKTAGYIPIGSAITSYARNFTIRTAQKNYYGKDKRGFIYADTDSIHCDLQPDELVGVPVHDKNFCCWKLESSWDIGWFVRQKTYIEHTVKENLEECEPFWNVKCAGMPDRCKQLFIKSMDSNYPLDNLTPPEKKFISQHRTLEDFNTGLVVPSKLMPKTIRGGVLLITTDYEMR